MSGRNGLGFYDTDIERTPRQPPVQHRNHPQYNHHQQTQSNVPRSAPQRTPQAVTPSGRQAPKTSRWTLTRAFGIGGSSRTVNRPPSPTPSQERLLLHASTSSSSSEDSYSSGNPFLQRDKRQPKAAFMGTNDPSTNGAVDDLVRMRTEQAEWAPTQLSFAHPADSSTNLLHPSSRFGSTASTPASAQFAFLSQDPAASLSASANGKKERPKTCYEDFEKGSKKLLTHSSHTYDIMPDMDMLHSFAPEKDDALHDPGRRAKPFGQDRRIADNSASRSCSVFLSGRGFLNAGALLLLMTALVGMFIAYPVITQVIAFTQSYSQGMRFTNASGQVPQIRGFRGLIDADTPKTALSRTGFDGKQWNLVFSDEFNLDGRTFYPGDDPYWTAVSTHYYPTDNLEYYDPRAATTRGGALLLNMTQQDPRTNHGFNYSSGMLQGWNQFCFTGGYIEVSINLPGRPDVQGFWPGAWTMGNLGRAGFGATNEGVWPYSYDSCDVGTLPNQTDPKTNGPPAAHFAQYPGDKGLSYQPGQRYSSCTCKGEDHPGPWLNDEKRYRGRSAPEIDIIEAAVESNGKGGLKGTVSQSAQFAPYDAQYHWHNKSNADFQFYPHMNAHLNPYVGGVYQQAVSGLPDSDQSSYELLNKDQYATYGFEWVPQKYGNGNSYVTWQIAGQPTWTLRESGMQANADAQIGARVLSNEPHYAILNFGMSEQFGKVDFDNLVFPAIMKVDYIRIYQRSDIINIGCSPDDYPTSNFIDKHIGAYTNSNLTVWADYTDKGFPKNKLVDQC